MASRFPVGGQKRRITKQLQRKEGKACGTPLSPPKNPQPHQKALSLVFCLLGSFWSPVFHASHLEVGGRLFLEAGTSLSGW